MVNGKDRLTVEDLIGAVRVPAVYRPASERTGDQECAVGAGTVGDIGGEHEIEHQIRLEDTGTMDHPLQKVALFGLAEMMHDHIRRSALLGHRPGVLGKCLVVGGVQDQQVHLDIEVGGRVIRFLTDGRYRRGACPVRGKGQADSTHAGSPVDRSNS